MNKTTITILSAAVTGLFLGGTYGCSGEGETAAPAAAAEMDLAKHACKALNECKGQGGCTTASNECAGKNECKGLGGCATIGHHDCAGKNECAGLGGCKTATNECAGKNECTGKGGCAVPVKK